MRLISYNEIPEGEILARHWNELVRQMECPEIFYTYEWALAVNRAYRASSVPVLMLAYEQDSLVGVVALATDIARRRTFFLASTTADYCDFVSAPTRRSEFVDLVLGELRRCKMPALGAANVPADSATCQALKVAAGLHGLKTFSRPAYLCAQIALGSVAERQNVKNFVASRKAFRYSLKSLAKHGPIGVDHLQSDESIKGALPEFMQVHIARFSGAGRLSNLAQPQRQVFLAELARLLSAAGWITLTRLRVGDHSVAWNYGFKFSGSWFYYQPTFDSKWRQYSPGFCLLSKIVEAACDELEIGRVDMGLGAEGYKERFATGARQTLDFTMTASTVHYLREAARYHVVAAIKSSPSLEHSIRRALGRAPVGGRQG